MRASPMIVLMLLASCARKESVDAQHTGAAKSPSTHIAGAASPAPSQTAHATLSVTGSYDAKVAEVRTPHDAPAFINAPVGALGAGQMNLALPPKDGPVNGTANGALGAQRFSGFLDGERLTGTLTPEPDASPAMWGSVLAQVEGAGDHRSVRGTLRASGADGRVVREASFTLQAAPAAP